MIMTMPTAISQENRIPRGRKKRDPRRGEKKMGGGKKQISALPVHPLPPSPKVLLFIPQHPILKTFDPCS